MSVADIYDASQACWSSTTTLYRISVDPLGISCSVTSHSNWKSQCMDTVSASGWMSDKLEVERYHSAIRVAYIISTPGIPCNIKELSWVIEW
jgi:hypothetical protein